MTATPRVFDDSWLPRVLEHREQSVSQLSRLLKPADAGARAEDVLIHGSSGVGKTVLARHTLGRLQEQALVPHARVRCLGKTTGGALLSALNQLPVTADVHRGLSIDERQRLLANAVDGPAVLVLDEADDLPETDVLDAVAAAPGVSAIVIIHDRDEWLSRLPGRHRGRFPSEHQIGLDRYTVDELADILQRRAELGLPGFDWDRQLLERIADDVAGVARRGIQTLGAAADVAVERESKILRTEDIIDGHERARKQIRESNLDSLPFHHQVLYELLRTAGDGGIDAVELHDRYEEIATAVYGDRPMQPIGKRSRRNKLQKLRSYDLVEGVDNGASVRYVARDVELVSPVDSLVDVPEMTPRS